jgi:hypothetical protein
MAARIDKPKWLLRPAIASLGVTVLAGCSYPNQFRNAVSSAPHASLVGKHVSVSHINRQPTSFWRTGERFRIPPGPAKVEVFTGFWDFAHYPSVEFKARAGHCYTLTHQESNGCHRVLVKARQPDATDERVIAQVEATRKDDD